MPEAAATQTETEADDVAASVAAAMDKLEADAAEEQAPDTEGSVSHETSPPADSPDDQPATDQAVTDQAADAAGETDDAMRQGQEAEGETQVADAIEYPQHWDQAHKAEFEALPPESQRFLLDRHKSMEADYTKKNMETADLRREYEPVDQMMRAFTPMMQQTGIGPGELIRRWAQAESYLNSQPEQAIKQLANHYGVDLAAIAFDSPAQQQQAPQAGESGYQDPQVQSLQSQVHNLSAQQNLQVINAFADEVGQDGQKLRPYFDEVAQTISQDLHAARMLGLQPSLQELYDQACWKTASVREKMIAAQGQQKQVDTQQRADQAAEEARKKAAQARAANKSITGDAGSNAEPKPKFDTIEEAAAAAFDKHTH